MENKMPLPVERVKQWARAILLVILCAAGLGAALWFIATHQYTAWDFRNNLWGPVHLLVTGHSPYQVEQLFQNTNAVWMPTAVGTFFALGWLPEAQATNLWAVINVALYLIAIALSTHQTKPSVLWFTLGLIGMFVFPGFVSLIRLGQISVLIMTLMLAASRCITTPRPWIFGLCVAVAAAKPQLIVLPCIGMLYAIQRQHKFEGTKTFLLAVVIWSAALTIPLWIGYPAWISDFVGALGRNPEWMQPSAFTLLSFLYSTIGFLIWGVLAALAFWLNLRIWRQLPPERAVSWSLALTVLVTPYAWSWDFVLIIPLLVQLLFFLRPWLLRITLMAGYTGIIYLMMVQRVSGDNDDWRFWWVSWSLVGWGAAMWAVQMLLTKNRENTMNCQEL